MVVLEMCNNLGSSSNRFNDLHLGGTGYFGTSVGVGTIPGRYSSYSWQCFSLHKITLEQQSQIFDIDGGSDAIKKC